REPARERARPGRGRRRPPTPRRGGAAGGGPPARAAGRAARRGPGAGGPWHTHPHDLLPFVVAGVWVVTLGVATRVVRAGDTWYTRPGIMH
ncbi:cupin domain-containing protein, partial [Klebsiella pneumoniae]|uniref:cupin domain-containing protein n=1 Tax=Klebsiella pneumoniae TaxID=573 RepID=UPI00351D6059